MRISSTVFLLALAAEVTVASSWFGRAAYRKWHETELERWLSDHCIPYPGAADRKELESIVKENWHAKVVSPYADWNPSQLQQFLKEKGVEVQEGTKQNKKWLASQVKQYWCEAEDQAEEAWGNARDWIFDTYVPSAKSIISVSKIETKIRPVISWSDSQLKAFLDKHGIPCPQPPERDNLLSVARHHYETISKEATETAAYPGNWLYDTWSNSELKAWLDEGGYSVPQPTTRDKLIASVRRNARVASLLLQYVTDYASKSAEAAKGSVSDKVFDSWSDSQIKEWADKNGIEVPQGSERNELLAIARKHKASLSGNVISASVSSAFGAATTKAGNQYAKAIDDAELIANDAFDKAIESWSETRLKAYLDSRGVPVPQAGRRDELLSKVRLQKHKAATGYSAWTFDTWTAENLSSLPFARAWLASQGSKAADQAHLTRDELLKQAQESYASASSSGESAYASITSALAAATTVAKDAAFETWSDSDLKSYLDSYGVPVHQGSTTNELRALALRQYSYFRYGISTPSSTIYGRLKSGMSWALRQLKIGAAKGQEEMEYRVETEGATYAAHRTGEETQKAEDRAKEEL